MNFTDDEIVIEPGHETRRWQSCNYHAKGVKLFHERSYSRTLPRSTREPTLAETLWFLGGPAIGDNAEQWTGANGTKAEIEALAAKHGGFAVEEFYAPEGSDSYFLAFHDTETALAFCRTEDFDRHVLTLEKLPA